MKQNVKDVDQKQQKIECKLNSEKKSICTLQQLEESVFKKGFTTYEKLVVKEKLEELKINKKTKSNKKRLFLTEIFQFLDFSQSHIYMKSLIAGIQD